MIKNTTIDTNDETTMGVMMNIGQCIPFEDKNQSSPLVQQYEPNGITHNELAETTSQISISPLTFTLTVPRGSHMNSSS